MPSCNRPSTGTYVLVTHLRRRQVIDVGRLGTYPFRRGYYLYVGSAFGPGGLDARIRRHLKDTQKSHWHIDYLDAVAPIVDVWFSTHHERLECPWAAILEGVPALEQPVRGFGASDCACRSHLFYSRERPPWSRYRQRLGGGPERWRPGVRDPRTLTG